VAEDAPAPRAGEQSACQPEQAHPSGAQGRRDHKAQAAKLHREDRPSARKSAPWRAPITAHHKAEQKALNQQENQVSKQIGK